MLAVRVTAVDNAAVTLLNAVNSQASVDADASAEAKVCILVAVAETTLIDVRSAASPAVTVIDDDKIATAVIVVVVLAVLTADVDCVNWVSNSATPANCA
jgi:hypothetical protein